MKTNWTLNSKPAAFFDDAADYHIIAFDVETDTTKDKNLKLLQFGLPNGKQYLFTPEYLPKLKQFLELKTLIAHNAIFEITVLSKYGVWPKKWIDTMLIEQVILGGDPQWKGVGLSKLMLRYFDIEMNKELQTTFGNSILTSEQYDYAAGDVAYLHELVAIQKQSPFYNKEVIDLEHKFLNVVAEMHLTGFKVDVEGWQKVITEMEIQREVALKKLDAYAKNVNWNSTKQKLEVLLANKVPVSNTAKGTLQKFSNMPLVRDLLAYNEINTMLTKLGAGFLSKINDNDIIQTNFKQMVQTGRMSSRAVNLQNITKDWRKYFTPSTKGNVFVSADYSQIELRLIGFAAGEQSWIDASIANDDLHKMCARILFPEFDAYTPEKQKEHRTKVKAINFSLSYGTGLKSLSKALGVSFREAGILVAKYYRSFPKIEAYLTAQSQFAKANKYTLTLPPYNRKRILPKAKPSKISRLGKNTTPQGTSADILKLACNKLYDMSLPIKITHVVHDAIIVETAPNKAQEIQKNLVACMEGAGDVICDKGLIRVDAEITNTWT